MIGGTKEAIAISVRNDDVEIEILLVIPIHLP